MRELATSRFGKWLSACAALGAICSAPAIAATFGSMQLVNNVRIASIFKGHYGPVYVTFTPATLTGCNGNYGGYLTSTWSEAMVGQPTDTFSPAMQFSLLLAARAVDSPLEVRYRVNSTGTGWDKCTIDAIWVQ